MRKTILTLSFVLFTALGFVQAQSIKPQQEIQRDSVVYETTFYYPFGAGNWVAKDNAKMEQLLRWAKTDTQASIVISGWADRIGPMEQNEKMSLRRAHVIRNYMVQQGIAEQRILFEGRGVDMQAVSNDKARRSDVQGIVHLVVDPKVIQPQPEEEIIPFPVVQEPPHQETVASVEQQPIVQQTNIDPVPNTSKTSPLRWYAGIEGGCSLGISTLTSFAHSETYVGWQVGLLGGYRISPILSAELGVSFGMMKLGASKCCEDYWLGADGIRYLEHVAGMDSYSYRDIYSSMSIQQYALRLNVELLQMAVPNWDKRWSLTFSPAIYGVNTTATLKQSGTSKTIIKRNGQFQMGAGAGIGAGYQMNKNLGVGLRTGLLWVFGERFDGISPTDHKENLIWNNTVTLTWRFGCNK